MGSLGSVFRGVATILLAAGAIGSVVSGLALLITLLVAKDRAGLAGTIFMISGAVLAVAAVLFGVARALTRNSTADPAADQP
ncbi:hypothetical protein BJY16_009038 [Actinoplanes octamycinicus]|uniref:Uncharacterized protein n=1 Tax=Actinoplanes octamycinicus TaxID=135948 RepID=A0A7W7MCW1_9ACTN|nr:hypothetical protein [Actinoplanes octamycinicus]MBB4745579.1 hypothetical protein [Actinoplanes octamycinicus]GIE56422.1 hypothetical protein Aoc01nite_18240 [Actinoplanes octamycinicus]